MHTTTTDITPQIEINTGQNSITLECMNIRSGDSTITKMSFDSESVSFLNVNEDQVNLLYQDYPNLELLHIDFFEEVCFGSDTYRNGFLGAINIITIYENKFVFSNGLTFDLNLLNNPNPDYNFNIFVSRFLPFLLKDGRFKEEYQMDVEKFIYSYI